jgi:hypothetical protein
MQVIISVHCKARQAHAYEFSCGDRVEDRKTHKRGRITFVYSELERKGEVIEVLFDGRDEVVDVPADGVRKVSTRQS